MKSELRHQSELLLKLSFEHGAAELAGDVERIMNTLCSQPKYELFPINYRMEGQTAVREFYRRILASNTPGTGNMRVGKAAGNLGDLDSPVDVLWTGTDSLVTRDDVFLKGPDGRERSLRFLSIFTLNGRLLEGEIIFTSAAGAEYMKAMLGPDFVDVDGVSVIE
jgi:hypothetical protein